MKLLADILRYVLTLFVYEQLTDYRLLYIVLECCQQIYCRTGRKRKVSLSQLIADHGIWSDVGNWRDLVEYMIKLKIEDSERRKKRREQLDNNKNDNNWNFGIGLKSSIVNTSILTDGFKGLKKLM